VSNFEFGEYDCGWVSILQGVKVSIFP